MSTLGSISGNLNGNQGNGSRCQPQTRRVISTERERADFWMKTVTLLGTDLDQETATDPVLATRPATAIPSVTAMAVATAPATATAMAMEMETASLVTRTMATEMAVSDQVVPPGIWHSDANDVPTQAATPSL